MSTEADQENVDMIIAAIDALTAATVKSDNTAGGIRDALINISERLGEVRDELRAITRQIGGLNP